MAPGLGFCYSQQVFIQSDARRYNSALGGRSSFYLSRNSLSYNYLYRFDMCKVIYQNNTSQQYQLIPELLLKNLFPG